MVVFTIVWRIENFSFFWKTSISPVRIMSPEFDVPSVKVTKWRLLIANEAHVDLLETQIFTNKKLIKLYVTRCLDGCYLFFNLHIETELLKVDGSLLHKQKVGKDCNNFVSGYFCVLRETFDHSCGEISQDVLIVRCKLWSTETSLLEEGKCVLRTYMTLGKMNFTAVVEGINNFIPGMTIAARITSASADEPIFTMYIYIPDQGNLIINIIGKNLKHLGFCEVLVLENSGKWVGCGQDSEWEEDRDEYKFPLTLDTSALIVEKQRYVQNDMITLKCQVAFYSEPPELKRIDEVEYESISKKKNEPQKLLTTLADEGFV